MSSFWMTLRVARNGRAITPATVVRAGLFLGAVASVSACTTPEQPDLNTYGAVQPVCLIACFLTFTLSEGDGSQGGLTTSVTTSNNGGDK